MCVRAPTHTPHTKHQYRISRNSKWLCISIAVIPTPVVRDNNNVEYNSGLIQPTAAAAAAAYDDDDRL